MDQIRYLKEIRVAPLLSNMVRELLIAQPTNDVDIYETLIHFLERVEDDTNRGARSGRVLRHAMLPRPTQRNKALHLAKPSRKEPGHDDDNAHDALNDTQPVKLTPLSHHSTVAVAKEEPKADHMTPTERDEVTSRCALASEMLLDAELLLRAGVELSFDATVASLHEHRLRDASIVAERIAMVHDEEPRGRVALITDEAQHRELLRLPHLEFAWEPCERGDVLVAWLNGWSSLWQAHRYASHQRKASSLTADEPEVRRELVMSEAVARLVIVGYGYTRAWSITASATLAYHGLLAHAEAVALVQEPRARVELQGLETAHRVTTLAVEQVTLHAYMHAEFLDREEHAARVTLVAEALLDRHATVASSYQRDMVHLRPLVHLLIVAEPSRRLNIAVDLRDAAEGLAHARRQSHERVLQADEEGADRTALAQLEVATRRHWQVFAKEDSVRIKIAQSAMRACEEIIRDFEADMSVLQGNEEERRLRNERVRFRFAQTAMEERDRLHDNESADRVQLELSSVEALEELQRRHVARDEAAARDAILAFVAKGIAVFFDETHARHELETSIVATLRAEAAAFECFVERAQHHLRRSVVLVEDCCHTLYSTVDWDFRAGIHTIGQTLLSRYAQQFNELVNRWDVWQSDALRQLYESKLEALHSIHEESSSLIVAAEASEFSRTIAEPLALLLGAAFMEKTETTERDFISDDADGQWADLQSRHRIVAFEIQHVALYCAAAMIDLQRLNIDSAWCNEHTATAIDEEEARRSIHALNGEDRRRVHSAELANIDDEAHTHYQRVVRNAIDAHTTFLALLKTQRHAIEAYEASVHVEAEERFALCIANGDDRRRVHHDELRRLDGQLTLWHHAQSSAFVALCTAEVDECESRLSVLHDDERERHHLDVYRRWDAARVVQHAAERAAVEEGALQSRQETEGEQSDAWMSIVDDSGVSHSRAVTLTTIRRATEALLHEAEPQGRLRVAEEEQLERNIAAVARDESHRHALHNFTVRSEQAAIIAEEGKGRTTLLRDEAKQRTDIQQPALQEWSDYKDMLVLRARLAGTGGAALPTAEEERDEADDGSESPRSNHSSMFRDGGQSARGNSPEGSVASTSIGARMASYLETTPVLDETRKKVFTLMMNPPEGMVYDDGTLAVGMKLIIKGPEVGLLVLIKNRTTTDRIFGVSIGIAAKPSGIQLRGSGRDIGNLEPREAKQYRVKATSVGLITTGWPIATLRCTVMTVAPQSLNSTACEAILKSGDFTSGDDEPGGLALDQTLAVEGPISPKAAVTSPLNQSYTSGASSSPPSKVGGRTVAISVPLPIGFTTFIQQRAAADLKAFSDFWKNQGLANRCKEVFKCGLGGATLADAITRFQGRVVKLMNFAVVRPTDETVCFSGTYLVHGAQTPVGMIFKAAANEQKTVLGIQIEVRSSDASLEKLVAAQTLNVMKGDANLVSLDGSGAVVKPPPPASTAPPK